jgi:hypothetical protein
MERRWFSSLHSPAATCHPINSGNGKVEAKQMTANHRHGALLAIGD